MAIQNEEGSYLMSVRMLDSNHELVWLEQMRSSLATLIDTFSPDLYRKCREENRSQKMILRVNPDTVYFSLTVVKNSFTKYPNTIGDLRFYLSMEGFMSESIVRTESFRMHKDFKVKVVEALDDIFENIRMEAAQ
jgi:hypothetical protein